MSAKVEVEISEYVKLLKKAMNYSMETMEYTCYRDKVEKPCWKFWKLDKYTNRPFTDLSKYWHVVNSYYPWNEVFGVFAVDRFIRENPEELSCEKITISTTLLAYTTMRAENYKGEDE